MTFGRWDDGTPRRFTTVVEAEGVVEATAALAAYVTDIHENAQPESKTDLALTMNEAIEKYLDHLADDKGREDRTIRDYRNIHKEWFAPALGDRRVKDVDEALLDRLFGKMRRAGRSRSRMNQARSLYGPFFRWGRHDA